MNENPFASPGDEELPIGHQDPTRLKTGSLENTFYYDADLYWKSTLYGCVTLMIGAVLGLPVIVIVIALLSDSRMPDMLVLLQFSGLTLILIAPIVGLAGILPGYLSYKKLLKDPLLILYDEGASVMSMKIFWNDIQAIKMQGNLLVFYQKGKNSSVSSIDSYYLIGKEVEDLIDSVEQYSGFQVK